MVKQSLIRWHGHLEKDHFFTDEIHWSNLATLDEMWPHLAKHHGEKLALVAPHAHIPEELTYSELDESIQQTSAAFAQLGIDDRDIVALISENGPRWLITDQGLMRAGAANAVRSINAPPPELNFIINDSGAISLVIESADILASLDLNISLLFILILEGNAPKNTISWERFVNYSLETRRLSFISPNPYRLATLVYTSGTTNKPKGVPLTHANLIHQVRNLGVVVRPSRGDKTLSVLPIWHAYERSVEYFLLSRGCCQHYTTLRQLRKDLHQSHPPYLPSVPRLWQALMEGFDDKLNKMPSSRRYLIKECLHLSRYHHNRQKLACNLSTRPVTVKNRILAMVESSLTWLPNYLNQNIVWPKVRKELVGKSLRTAICGGGTLAPYIDSFFEAIGIELLVGYGLTETSPVLTCRRKWANRSESVGYPLPSTNIKIVDPNTNNPLGWGEKGKVLAQGTQVMKGYFRYGAETNNTIISSNDGWFDTGDLGKILSDGSLILTGRLKEVIVLTNGENIDPVPLEACLCTSELVKQILIIGQDQRYLVGLVVLREEILLHSIMRNSHDNNNLELIRTIKDELNRKLSERVGSRIDERLSGIILVEPFTVENGCLTQTLKQRRDKILRRYSKSVSAIYSFHI